MMNFENIFKSLEEKEEIKLSYYIINYCNERNIEITNLKLMKLLYFVNIEYMLLNKGKPIIDSEFLAWRHGPVLQTLYNYFKMGLVLPTDEQLKKIFNDIHQDKKEVMNQVLSKLANLAAWDLVNMTHIKNGPWETTYNKYKGEDGICTTAISHYDIYEFYKSVDGTI